MEVSAIEFSDGVHWKKWMNDYRYGSLVFIPKGKVFHTTHELRQKYDPVSAEYSMPHMTLTQPFSNVVSKEDILKITKVISSINPFDLTTGPIVTSPSGGLIWVDVEPKDPFVRLRNELHDTGLFRTDLPYTDGFVPHMTISEFGDHNPVELMTELNKSHNVASTQELNVSWVVPNEKFEFQMVHEFKLGK